MVNIKSISQLLSAITLLGFPLITFFLNFLEKQVIGLGWFVGVILFVNLVITIMADEDNSQKPYY